MSNLSINDKQQIINDKRIIIQDNSDDSFFSQNSDILLNNENCIKPKKTFCSKINDNTEVVIDNSTKKNKPVYNKNKILLNKTKEILEKSYNNYQNSLEKYYEDVLKWMNILYSMESKSITKIKFKKMTLNEEIFNLYNQIVKKYKLDKDLFIIENFNINDEHERTEIFTISKILTNNLLDKLNYKLVEYKKGNAIGLKLQSKIKYF